MLVTECAAFFFTPNIGCAHLILHDVKLNFEEDLLDIKELNIKSKNITPFSSQDMDSLTSTSKQHYIILKLGLGNCSR